MFFFISKIFAPFSVPLTYIFIFLVIALAYYRRKPRLGRTCLLLAVLLVMICGTNPLPDVLIRTLESRYQRMASLPQVDAVIVLTGIVVLDLTTPTDIEFGEGVERILAGIKLIKAGYGKFLIIAGGSGDLLDQTKREAVLLRQFAIEQGVPAAQILIDADSRNTYENAVNTKKMMAQQQLASSLLITTAAHLPRALGCFEKIGLAPIPYPVDFRAEPTPSYDVRDLLPSAGALKNTEFALHEYIGILTYKLAGYI